jgi:transcriptional regulator GlxA family with amidase domain
MAEDPDLLNCQRWLHQNLSNHDVIEDMAARSDLPSDKFHRRFKAETGFAAQSYVDLARTEEAKYLLRTTETTIEEIAEQIGFLDEHQFKSVFHREAGISASQYRAPPCLVPLDQAEQRRTSMMIWKRIEKMRREVHSHAAV